MDNLSNIQVSDLVEIWKAKNHNLLGQKNRIIESKAFKDFMNSKFEVIKMTEIEKNSQLSEIEDVLQSDLKKSGPNRITDWEKGWGENLNEFIGSNNIGDLSPKYFGKNNIFRLDNEFYRFKNENPEPTFLAFLVDLVIEIYGKDSGIENILEFGCGTAHHLVRIRKNYQSFNLFGLDWAKSSQEIIKSYAERNSDLNFYGENFDYFKPNEAFTIPENSIVLTVASLEQIGENHAPFLEYLIASAPKYVINIEPVGELLDPNNRMEKLSVEYFKNRNYLKGYLSALIALEKAGRIEMITAERTYFGSMFIEGYSLLIWRPVYESTS